MSDIPVWYKFRETWASGYGTWQYDFFLKDDSYATDEAQLADIMYGMSDDAYFMSEMFRGLKSELIISADVPYKVLEHQKQSAIAHAIEWGNRSDIIETALVLQRFLDQDKI